jgi:hypothetical protein
MKWSLYLWIFFCSYNFCFLEYGNSMSCFIVHKILFHFLFSQRYFEIFIVSFILPISCPGSENWSMQNIELDFRSLILCSVLFYFIIIIFYSSRIRICYRVRVILLKVGWKLSFCYILLNFNFFWFWILKHSIIKGTNYRHTITKVKLKSTLANERSQKQRAMY